MTDQREFGSAGAAPVGGVQPWQLLFGFAFGMATAFADHVFPRIGPALLFSCVAMYLTTGAIVVWRRTGLRVLASAGAVGAASEMYLVFHPDFSNWNAIGWVFSLGGFAIMVLLVFLQSRLSRARWQQLQESVKTHPTFADVLLLRHIPHLQ
jgi:hypothetical protein